MEQMNSGEISVSNWSDAEKDYESSRTRLLKQVSSAEVASSPFVYMTRQLVSTCLTRIQLFETLMQTGVHGSVVECGVHKGNSLMLWSHLSSILEPFNFNRKIIGFDTFEGFSSLSTFDDARLSNIDFSDTNFEHLTLWANLQEGNRPVSHISKIELIKGDATETIPAYVASNPHLIVAMLYLDFDIYKPTMTALEHLLPLVPRSGIVGFDEVGIKKFSGETIALKESLKLGNIELVRFHYDPWVSYYKVT